MTETEKTKIWGSARIYRRVGPLFICSLFVGVYIAQGILKWEPLNFVYVGFAETQGIVAMMILIFASVMLYIGSVRSVVKYRTTSRTMLLRNITVIVFSIVLTVFFLSFPDREASVQASQVNTIISGASTYGLFLARYGMMYYWVVRRFSEFRSIDRIVQLAVWVLWAWRDTPLLLNYTPWIADIVDWLRLTVYTGALRGVLFTVACGAMVITIRALMGREPGLIEMEAV